MIIINNLQNATQKTNDRVTQTALKTGGVRVNSDSPQG